MGAYVVLRRLEDQVHSLKAALKHKNRVIKQLSMQIMNYDLIQKDLERRNSEHVPHDVY